jgi:alpha-galactosidase
MHLSSLFLLLLSQIRAYDNGASLGGVSLALPPRGWATWCTDDVCGLLDFCNEAEVMQIADAMVESGLRALNYSLILLDDCWSSTNRSATGQLQPDAARFPSGMPALVAYLSARDLGLGLYTCAGSKTCKYGRPGSEGHYREDADTLIGWGVSYIKADNCAAPGGSSHAYFSNFSSAINASAIAAGRPVAFASCQWGLDDVAAWGPSQTQLYRINPDHLPFWSFDVPNAYPPGGQGTSDLIEKMADPKTGVGLAPFSYPDPDFLMTGLFQTDAEGQTEFSFWSLWSAPLLVSTDVRNMSAWKRSVLLNVDALAIQGDALLSPAVRVWMDNSTKTQVWLKTLANGDAAVVLYNGQDWAEQDVSVQWAQLGGTWTLQGLKVNVYDIWAHAQIVAGEVGGWTAKSLPPHGSAMWRLTQVTVALL